ncbi:class I SAM-dependent methyltransferase [Maribacter algarum]|uniref:Class I SAM-dependent methyltransferase n=1 Tax=Maribacter algarum (ex Zhang et al. 2020) TaxID=2578118 RepID=A0A5S3PVH8_9FLAO|nr:class I SAM-dependent methyltransferase [Maribacter algarum]TMM58973.1 class I SAM-dependent methyltransferase [Maribacter algarum]
MKPFLKTKDFSISQETFELFHNPDMDMLITKPQPENLDSYYESEVYISHTDSNTSFIDKIYQRVKKYSLSKKINLIDKYSKGKKTLLDVGAGTGDFLKAAKNKGWNIEGVEPNHSAREKALDKGISLKDRIEALTGTKYDVITLWHVLEHLPDLENQILKLIWHLEENGTLIIAVPNFNSFDAKHYKEFWAAYDVPRHLWHFSRTSIEKIFAEHDFKLVKVKPMVFDSFYVSILSEKYKTGRQNIFKAFVLGLWSNLSAIRTKEYSSHIYVLQKC